MEKKNISVVIFYTENNKILLQERKGISKSGEKWGFFGGHIEDGETKEEAAVREIMEELEFKLENFDFLGSARADIKNLDGSIWDINCEIFLRKTDENLDQFNLKEGSDMKFFTIAEARKLKIAYPIDNMILDMIEGSLQQKKN